MIRTAKQTIQRKELGRVFIIYTSSKVMKLKRRLFIILLLVSLWLNITTTYAMPTAFTSSPLIVSNSHSAADSDSTGETNSDKQSYIEAELPKVEAEGAMLMCMKTGKILYEKNIHERFYPASTTKILTALLAIEHGHLDDIVTVGEEANLVQRDGTIAGLDLGEEISLKKLIYGLMLPSGNDAAYTIAVYVARKLTGDPDMPMHKAIDYFSDMMNERAKAAGAKNSHFSNPHGYHSDDHYTTPYDIAMIAREAMKHAFFREVVSTRTYIMDDWSGVDEDDPSKKLSRPWKNTNLLIDEHNKKFYYPYATGIKTGYTSHAGQCLVSSAQQNSLDLIAVVFRSSRQGKWTDSTTLFEYGFENFDLYELVEQGEVLATIEVDNHSDQDEGIVNLVAQKGHYSILKKGDMDRIEPRIIMQPKFEAPLKKGQVLGQISYHLDGNLLFKTKLISDRDIEKDTMFGKGSKGDKPETTKSEIGGFNIKDRYITCAILALFLIFLYSMLRKKNKRRHMF